MPQLYFSRNHQAAFQVNLSGSSTKIGRSAQCDIVLSEPEISREHAAIFCVEGQYLIKKLGKGPILVNGEEVESRPLKNQDIIQFGPWEARFQPSAQDAAPAEDTQLSTETAEKTQVLSNRSQGLLIQEFALEVKESNHPARIYPIRSNTITVGAGPQNDLVLEDPYISTRHLKVTHQDDRFWLHDLGSTNGTFLDRIQVREAELEAGMSIRLGQCVLTLVKTEKLETKKRVVSERFHGLVGACPQMQELYGLLERLGPADATVLILGESGSGKELVARAVHDLSPRARSPFIAINCGAISKELIESELFGHEKGAFTGAQRQHEGAFAQAKGGTLFLDEIGELPLDLQPKLLRVLENRRYRRVGGSEELTADVRVVAATHRDLAEQVKAQLFREDLFFRLFVLPIYIPPLRERAEDLPLLVETFLKEFSPNQEGKNLSSAALQKLKAHPFPGNVRELRNILLRSVILTKGSTIDAGDLMFPQQGQSAPANAAAEPLGIQKLEEMERWLILKALNANRWNKTKTADALGIAKSTLFAKLKLYNLESLEPKN